MRQPSIMIIWLFCLGMISLTHAYNCTGNDIPKAGNFDILPPSPKLTGNGQFTTFTLGFVISFNGALPNIMSLSMTGRGGTTVIVMMYDESNVLLFNEMKTNTAGNAETVYIFMPSPMDTVLAVKKITVEVGSSMEFKNLKMRQCPDVIVPATTATVEPCICRVRGDPVIENCEMENGILKGKENYTLAEYTGPADCTFKATIETEAFEGSVIPMYLEFTIPYPGGTVYRINRAGELYVNNNLQNNPESYDDGTVSCEMEQYGRFLQCTESGCGTIFAFYGEGKMSETMLTLPGDILNDVTGNCITIEKWIPVHKD